MHTNLNSQQRAVVDWIVSGRGSLNLIARAGTGKTHTLIQGAVRAIVEHQLGEVAIMAFNKSAADEFKARIAKLADETKDARFSNWKLVQPGTFHSFGFSAVRRWSPSVKVNEDKVWALIDAMIDQKPTMNDRASAVKKLVSLAKQSGFGFLTRIENRAAWADLIETHDVDSDLAAENGDRETAIETLISESQEILRRSIAQDRDVIDFDDMILAPLVHDLRLWWKDWVLVDEAQDTNASRRALALKMLKPRTGRLIAVGDDRQAIYGFTGADSDALDLIRAELNSAVLPLTITYRCPKAVVAEANRLVPDLVAHDSAPEGVVASIPWSAKCSLCEGRKKLLDGSDCQQCGGTGDRTWYHVEKPTPSDALLCRNTKPLVETAYRLLADGIGCRVEGREIGEGLVNLTTRWKRIKNLTPLTEKLIEYRDRRIQTLLAKGQEAKAQGVEDQVNALLTIITAVRAVGKDTVADVVDHVRGLFGDTKPGEVPNVVTLSTIHKAKGREWERVYLLHRAQTLPSRYARKPWQLRQEENLEYVAITRAKRELVFVD